MDKPPEEWRAPRDAVFAKVKRALPVFGLAADPAQVIHPEAETCAILMSRLQYEAARRGQPVPSVPAEPPAPSAHIRRPLPGR